MNELLFLGTCACDFSPKLKTEFADCFDKNARRSSSALLNGRFLIDCGMHTPDCLRISKTDITKITDIFITHTHCDHFDPKNIESVAAASKSDSVRLWVSEDAEIPEIKGVTVIRMEKFKEYTVCDGLTVTGLEANHDPVTAPQWLLFNTDGKKFLYALDGAWYTFATYYYLKKAEVDLMVCDATVGDYDGDYRIAEHNSIPMIRMMVPSLKKFGVINDDTEIYLSHIAPSLHKPHDTICEAARSFGGKVAFDGLKIEY